MNATLVKALIGLILVGILVAVSVAQVTRKRTPASFLGLFGAGCLVVVALTHVTEALRLFPRMQWGDPYSIGHYIDMTSAILGIALLLGGYVLQVYRSSRSTAYTARKE